MGILSLILWTPLAGLVLILLTPGARQNLIKTIALGSSGLVLLLTIYVAMTFDLTATDSQFVERLSWVPEMGITYALGVDGVALAMLLLTTIVTLFCILASGSVDHGIKAYFAWFMILEFSVLGVFMAQDWFLFYTFWEIALVPMFFLIGMWGGEKRGAASLSFFLYTLAGSVFMLLGIVAVYVATPGNTFAMDVISAESSNWSPGFQAMVFFGFFVGVAVKIPSFPLHGWLPLAHVEAPVPVSMFLSAVMLKMGAYGLIRAGVMLPEGLQWFLPILLTLGFINLVYGALLAWRQTDLKAMVAYSSISHMGFVLIGVAALTVTGVTGAVLQMVSHGFISAALFFLVGVIYQRTHTREIGDLTGLGRQMPYFAILTSIAFFASMGLPGMAGFVAEFHVILGAFERWGMLLLIALVGILVTAAYSLRTVARMFTGPTEARWSHLSDIRGIELATAVPVVALIVLLGVIPGITLALISPAVAEIVAAMAN